MVNENFGHGRRWFHRLASCRKSTRGWAWRRHSRRFQRFLRSANQTRQRLSRLQRHRDPSCRSSRQRDCAQRISPGEIWGDCALGGARGSSSINSTAATLLQHECRRHLASARCRSRDRGGAIYLCVELVRLRHFENSSLPWRSTSDSDAEPIRRHKNCGWISLFDVFASLSNACGRAALLYSLRSAATTRSGNPSIHTTHLRGSADRPVRRRHDATRLHLHWRHYPRYNGGA